MATILVVDDDETVGTAFRQFLADEGHEPVIVGSAADAIQAVQASRPDLVIMDIRMPGTDGLEALRRLREALPDLYVVMMTAYGTSQTSIEAMRLGAFDYLTKPLDLDDLRVVIARALDAQRASREAGSPQAGWEKYSLVNLVGTSERMQEVYKLIGRLTTNDVPTLIVGEHGTGRQLVAHTIHFNSPRREKPFVSIDCQSLPEPALEVDLFGRESGGQITTGKLEAAHGGTVFLGSIEALPLPLQVRLSRWLAERGAARVGGVLRVTSEARLIAATGKDLSELVRQGSFSRELYEAIGVITIALPPLRQRKEDIPELVAYFIRRVNAELDRSLKGVDDRVMQMLVEHPWPGNVAELATVIKRACILARADIVTPDDLGSSLRDTSLPGRQEMETALRVAVRGALHQRLIGGEPGKDSPFHEIVGVVEETLVREALRVTNNNQVKAAELLGLNRATLRKKMTEPSA
jgi:DNA-binding NtrC family response regulator